MKNKYLFIGLLVCFTMLIAFSAFNRNDIANSPEMAAEYDAANGVGGAFYADYRLDTLTDGAVETWNIGRRNSSLVNTVSTPTNFISLYTGRIQMHPRSISGTQNLTLCLDAANDRAGAVTSWVPIDSIASTTTLKPVQLTVSSATANRYRIRIKGSGTQVSSYLITSTWKKVN